MSIAARITAVLALVLAVLAALWRVHVTSDRAGYSRAQAAQLAQAAALSEKRRMDEKALSLKSEEIDRDLQRKKADLAKRDADRDDRLREYQAALDRRASEAAATASGVDDAAARIAGECAQAIGALDGYSQRLRIQLASLQGWVGQVCVSKPD